MDGEIDPADVEAALDDEDGHGLIVDVRSPASFDRGHIPGSVNVPLGELPTRVETLELDVDRVVAVCPHGEASVQAARLVAAYEGCEAPVFSMAGGLTAWEGPLTAGDGTDDDEGSDADDEGPEAPF